MAVNVGRTFESTIDHSRAGKVRCGLLHADLGAVRVRHGELGVCGHEAADVSWCLGTLAQGTWKY
jgi:hypothetical protein